MSAEPLKPRRSPCASCPYRCAVPSGIWERDEYDKLPTYDGDIPQQLENPDQALAVFLCHQNGQEICAGWLGHREDPTDLLAVRMGLNAGHLDPVCAEYATDVELFASGAQAAEHGARDLTAPSEQAQQAISKITVVRSGSSLPLVNPIRRPAPIRPIPGDHPMSNFLDRITLIYRDAAGGEHTQPLADITEAGTLIDPEDGSDMELIDARIRPVGNPITLGAESVRAELDEAPEVHDLTIEQAEHIAELSDEEIDRAVNAEVDDHFWAAYDDARRRAISNLVDQLGIDR